MRLGRARNGRRQSLITSAAFGIGLAMTLLAGCGKPGAGLGGPAAGVRPSAVPVVTAVATVQPLGTIIEALGTARSNESVDITSKSSNTVTAIVFHEGEFVGCTMCVIHTHIGHSWAFGLSSRVARGRPARASAVPAVRSTVRPSR